VLLSTILLETIIQIMVSFCWIIWMVLFILFSSSSSMQHRTHDLGMKFLHGWTYLFIHLLFVRDNVKVPRNKQYFPWISCDYGNLIIALRLKFFQSNKLFVKILTCFLCLSIVTPTLACLIWRWRYEVVALCCDMPRLSKIFKRC
jgi:hypothetical protein